ncbi:hypothetical protein Q7P35_007826 [Cladosporium inversicolor]
MGKRKSSSKPQGPKKREGLDTKFKCVFCNSEDSISTKIDKKAGVASLSCKNCVQSYQMSANYLTQPVDVYFDWIDACDAVAQEQNPQPASSQPAMPRVNQPKSRAGLAPGEKVTAEDDGFIDDEGVEDEEDFRDEE